MEAPMEIKQSNGILDVTTTQSVLGIGDWRALTGEVRAVGGHDGYQLTVSKGVLSRWTRDTGEYGRLNSLVSVQGWALASLQAEAKQQLIASTQ